MRSRRRARGERHPGRRRHETSSDPRRRHRPREVPARRPRRSPPSRPAAPAPSRSAGRRAPRSSERNSSAVRARPSTRRAWSATPTRSAAGASSLRQLLGLGQRVEHRPREQPVEQQELRRALVATPPRGRCAGSSRTRRTSAGASSTTGRAPGDRARRDAAGRSCRPARGSGRGRGSATPRRGSSSRRRSRRRARRARAPSAKNSCGVVASAAARRHADPGRVEALPQLRRDDLAGPAGVLAGRAERRRRSSSGVVAVDRRARSQHARRAVDRRRRRRRSRRP